MLIQMPFGLCLHMLRLKDDEEATWILNRRGIIRPSQSRALAHVGRFGTHRRKANEASSSPSSLGEAKSLAALDAQGRALTVLEVLPPEPLPPGPLRFQARKHTRQNASGTWCEPRYAS